MLGSEGKRTLELILNGHRVSVRETENVLQADRGEGCTTILMYLIPQNFTLKMVKISQARWCIHIILHSGKKLRQEDNKIGPILGNSLTFPDLVSK